MTISSSPRPHITPRKVKINFHPEIPKHWLGGSAVATHITNGVNLLFPEGERFFVRSVRHYADRLPPEQREEARAFYQQEGSHAREHERYFEILEAQGYEIRAFVARFRRAVLFLERWSPPQLRLAATAAAEHFTAVMAENALTDEQMFEATSEEMKQLLLWHAAEEIEHKAVAFDVLQRVAPAYGWRVGGLIIATLMLCTFWYQATRMLLRQDGFTKETANRDIEGFRRWRVSQGLVDRDIFNDVIVAGIKDYLRPSFHPWENDNLHLATRYLGNNPPPSGAIG